MGDAFLGYPQVTKIAEKALTSMPLDDAAQDIIDQVRAFAGGKLGEDVCMLVAQWA